MKNLMKMGGVIDKKTSTLISIIGLIFIIFIWYLVTEFGNISATIFPKPISVLHSFKELIERYNIFSEAWYSIKLNFYGYIEAIAISLPLGFAIGLFPLFRGLLSGWVDSVRFLPLTAVTGLFIGWFGIELDMKVHFLAFGIIIYLLPIIVKRIDDVEKVHLQTIWTIGANNWQTFRHVYLPSVTSKLFNDIKVIVAISWSYIIVAEMINAEGGVGSLIFKVIKQGRIDLVFGILIVIVIIGFINDLIFTGIDLLLFPFNHNANQVKSAGIFSKVKSYLVKPVKA